MTIESQDDTNPKYCTDRTNQTLYLVDRIEELSMPRCDIVKLQNEIKQLKELLRECRTIICENILGDYVIELCERITNAIGEKK